MYEQVQEEMFILKDQDTGKLQHKIWGNVYDIRNTDKIPPVNKEYMAKLKKRHKSAW